MKHAKSDPLVVYMGPAKGPFRCDRCEYFVEPRACWKVSGDIDPAGCCNLFYPEPSLTSLRRSA